MNKWKYTFLFLVIIFIFISFTLLNPMPKKLLGGEESFSLDAIGMNIHHKPPHKPPLFFLKKNGCYFIQPAKEVSAKVIFTFKEDMKLFWNFSIQKGSAGGKILFIIKKNSHELKKFFVKTDIGIPFDIKVKKDDKITIIANSSDGKVGAWGNLKILKYESNYIFKLRLIPFLWVVFFIYLVGKGHFYIAFNSYIGFLLALFAEKLTFGPLGFADISVYTVFFFCLAFLFTIIYQELRILKKFKIATLLSWIATIVLYAISIAFIIFSLVFGKPIDWNILSAIYQTNFNESLGFIESFIPISYLLGTLIFTFLVGYLFLRQEMKERQIIERSLLMFIIILLAGFISTHFIKLRIPNLIYNTFLDYNKKIDKLIAFQEKRKTSKIKFSAIKKEKGEIYVVVIGESLNKNNMSLYGHFRNTSPKLLAQKKKSNLQVFNNAYSNAGSTMPSLSLALTEANQYNNRSYLNSLSFIDIFNKAGFDTYWLTTQLILNGSNTIVSVLAQSSNHVLDLVNNVKVRTGFLSYYDSNTIEGLKENISKNKNGLYIIHIYGNHFRYKDRYPEAFSKYKKSLPFILGTDNKTILEDYSAYDNAVYFNDDVINNLLDIVQNQGGVSAFLYFSDHGEDIAHHHGHTSRPESFTYPMSQIPLVAWLSPGYIKRYPETYKVLHSHKDKLFSNDMIYDTILGLAHIQTNHYNALYDLSSPKYHLDPSKALVLHGGKHYANADNYIYWQKYNTQFLQDQNLSHKLIIDDTNTVGKLNDAWRLGFRSFGFNLYYSDVKKSFQAGVEKIDAEGNFIELLKYISIDKIEHLLLKLTNLSKLNIKNAMKRIEEIDQKIHIKEKSILLVNQVDLLKILKRKGWKTTFKVDENNKNQQLVYNKSDYLISDIKIYNRKFIRNIQNNFIIEDACNLYDSNLHKKANGLQYFKDKRIKFMLVDLKSEYEW